MESYITWKEHYPRPQMKRKSFMTLNGSWFLNGEPIEIPFAPEAKLADYRAEAGEELHYEKHFTLSKSFLPEDHRLMLHFGAVDQVCDVLVNGHFAVHHEGGYLPFSADITDLLLPGENTLVVNAVDTLSPKYPYGKQRKDRGGMWYTPVSGIWQSVWLEAVPSEGVKSLRMLPDLTGVTLWVDCGAKDYTVTLKNGQPFVGKANEPLRMEIENPRPWSPKDPYLYDFTITAGSDAVSSYFALRTVEIKTVGAHPRVCLNGEPVFLNGVLDQGYFSDGLYLPYAPEGYEKDIQRMQNLGINLLRKHIKIEPEAFYYECDRLGMLVMQDMVNSGTYSFLRDTAAPTVGLKRRRDTRPGDGERKAFFEQHTLDTLFHLYNHPCVIAYTIFNEGWGQFDADRLYVLCKKTDSSRVYDAASGWFWQHESDFDSEHIYFRNKVLKRKKRVLFLSECGGYQRAIPGHMYTEENSYGYGKTDSEEALNEKIMLLYDKMVLPSIKNGLCGVIYTQVSDVEDEINGLYTYDREVCKVSPFVMRDLAAQAEAAFKENCEIE